MTHTEEQGRRTVELVKTFSFDSAHFMPHMPEGHPYRRMHGHSFEVTVALQGVPDPATGWLIDLEKFEAALGDLKQRLDHRLLNDVAGLEAPTLERLALWIADQLSGALPGLAWVRVARPGRGEAATHRLTL